MRELTYRELNRALLARQGLLVREDVAETELIERLVGLQAQVPDAPYVGLWSRIAGYRPDALAADVAAARVVRMTLMRSTIHLVTARDALTLEPAFREMVVRRMRGSDLSRGLNDIDIAAVQRAGVPLITDGPLTRVALGQVLAPHWPDAPPASLGAAVIWGTPTAQAPPRGVWRARHEPAWVSLAGMLGREPGPAHPLPDLIRRYLAAFGPASPADMARWSGLTGLSRAFRPLRPELRTYRGPGGEELFDVEDGPMPHPETPAQPRFLGEYDNVLLSHRDRGRVMRVQELPGIPGGYGAVEGTVLIDGMLGAVWKITVTDAEAVLTVAPYEPLSPDDEAAVAAEGAALLRFVHPDATGHNVRFGPPGQPFNPWAAAARRRTRRNMTASG